MTESECVLTDYLDYAIDTRKLAVTVDRCVKLLRNYEFDAIAFRGNSGALVAPSVALALDKGLILVRKDTESHHSSCKVEGHLEARSYIIIDDRICSGATIDAIVEGVSLHCQTPMEFKGVLCYDRLHDGFTRKGETQTLTSGRVVTMLHREGVVCSREELCEILEIPELLR